MNNLVNTPCIGTPKGLEESAQFRPLVGRQCDDVLASCYIGSSNIPAEAANRRLDCLCRICLGLMSPDHCILR
ncbi:Hypothetical protein CGLY_01890 [Corynebacterium glyciniphilum AJ 3170]|uniref:Uncharacterized protein n=1 Tax=Corynebacterium glyciniphilum AJ 3170 TaxID=1404245 RepID=X5E851_9CORY|nr:Hypothetical protein CGLY_01890 [Corynebacterium glyciniphilum AJ 3170]